MIVQDPRVEAVADPLCRMLGRLQPIDRAPLMIADAVRGRAREFLAAADAAANLPTHRHRKGGEYVLIGYGEHTETGGELAIYRSAKTDRLWCRPKAMFEDGRFAPIAPPPSPAVPLDGEGERDAAEPTEDEVERAARAMIAEMSLRLAMVVEISLHRDEGDPTDWADLSEDDRRAAMQVARSAITAARSQP